MEIITKRQIKIIVSDVEMLGKEVVRSTDVCYTSDLGVDGVWGWLTWSEKQSILNSLERDLDKKVQKQGSLVDVNISLSYKEPK